MSKDTIYRQDAIDAADRADYTGLAVEDVKKVTDEVVKEIKKLPSAQPETPMQIGWICPVCGRGLSPLTSVCPCNNGKGWEITC